MRATESTPEQLLRRVGLRVTAPRLVVLGALAEATDHPDADAIAVAARARLGTLSTQAVYDVLHALVDAGLVRRIEPAGGPARFEARVGDNHHHVVCRACRAAADVDCVVGAAPCLEPSDAHGYVVDEAEVIFWGACFECQSGAGTNKGVDTPRATSRPTGRATARPASPIERSSPGSATS